MMTRYILTTIQLLIFLFSITNIIGQSDSLKFEIDSGEGHKGSVVCIDIKAINFTNIESLQMSFSYDATLVIPQCPLKYEHPAIKNAIFNPTINCSHSENGYLNFVWASNPTTIPSDDIIFTICFDLIGNPGNTSPVFLSDVIFSIEVCQALNNQSVCTNNVVSNVGQITITSDNLQMFYSVCNYSKLYFDNVGELTFYAAGGVPPYNYSINDGQYNGVINEQGERKVISNLPKGKYIIEITDTNGIKVTSSEIKLSSPSFFNHFFEVEPATCGLKNGRIDIDFRGDYSPYYFQWSNYLSGPGLDSLKNLNAGNYQVTITDNKGCQVKDSVALGEIRSYGSCKDAKDLGIIPKYTKVTGNNFCGNQEKILCHLDNNNTEYYTFTTSDTTDIPYTFRVSPKFFISVSKKCDTISQCDSVLYKTTLERNTIYYVIVSSSTKNAGEYELEIFQGSTISGKVYIDYNVSGSFENSDFGIRNVPVNLMSGCGNNLTKLASTITDEKGVYSFAVVTAGSYTVQIGDGSGAPDGDPSPRNCCLIIDNTQPDTILYCDLGFPPPNCTSNPYSVENLCQSAFDISLCDLSVIGDFACGQNPSVLGPWAGMEHCGGKFQNTSFFGFVAGRGSYSIQFTIFACAGTGVQYGIMDACNPSGPFIVCNGAPNTGTVTVDCSNLIPGKNYIFWIDGYSGSVCSYYIQVIGDFQPYKPPAISDIIIESLCAPLCPSDDSLKVCLEMEDDLLDPTMVEGLGLIWDITYPDGNFIYDIQYTKEGGLCSWRDFLTGGTITVCLTLVHPCYGLSEPFCKDFLFLDAPVAYKEIELCESQFPWSGILDSLGVPLKDEYGNRWAWSQGDISLSDITEEEQDFFSNLKTPCGCSYTQVLKIKSKLTGNPCDDNNPATINDAYQSDCSCKGETGSGTNDEFDGNITIVPNPNNGNFVLKGLYESEVNWSISDDTGIYIDVPHQSTNSNDINFDLSAEKNGTYILKLQLKDRVIFKKIVKQ